MAEELWTTAQVMEHLGVNYNNLRQMQHRGSIQWVSKQGKNVFYSANAIRAYARKREHSRVRVLKKKSLRNPGQTIPMLIIEEETISELDEALAHVAARLKTDEFGNRMDWKKKELLQSSIDDLLDARLAQMSKTVSQQIYSGWWRVDSGW